MKDMDGGDRESVPSQGPAALVGGQDEREEEETDSSQVPSTGPEERQDKEDALNKRILDAVKESMR